jgi:amidase
VDGELVTQAFITVWSAGVAWMVDGFALLSGKTPDPDQFEPLTWALYEMGRGSRASDYLLSLTLLQMVSRDIARFFNRFDAWLTPTVSEPPVPLGTFDSPSDNPIQGLLRAAEFVPFTAPFNFTGQPAMSVPLYWNDEGLPIGTQFVGRFGDEATLFRLAGQLEAARPWADRRPPLWR